MKPGIIKPMTPTEYEMGRENRVTYNNLKSKKAKKKFRKFIKLTKDTEVDENDKTV